MDKRRIVFVVIIAIIACLAVGIGAIFFLKAYSPANKQTRISKYAGWLRDQIETQAKEKYGYDWENTVSIKDITAEGTKWYEIDHRKWVFTVSFNGTDETIQYKLANQKQYLATTIHFREVITGQKSVINYNPAKKEFRLIPSGYGSFLYQETWSDLKVVSLSAEQQKELVELFSEYSAVTTDEVAFEDNYRYTARFTIQFPGGSGPGSYGLGVCIGRDGTEECYAVSTFSNHCYARIVNDSELYKKACLLLRSWGII